ncbi:MULTISPECIES: hypothetical protein [Acutalibacteraceae]|uniref:hypothetical protein n=1 Tax=Acutalibacteraceae TaxID=3082771 RepID=UPI0013E89E24|nr:MULTISPECIES: hypothetical protein [Acutalibacteraceae]
MGKSKTIVTFAAVIGILYHGKSPRPKNVPPARFLYGLPNPSFLHKKSGKPKGPV